MEKISMRRVIKNRNTMKWAIQKRQILDENTIHVAAVITVQTVMNQSAGGVECLTNLVGIILDASSEDSDFEIRSDVVDELLGARAEGDPDGDRSLVRTHVDVKVEVVSTSAVSGGRTLSGSVNESLIKIEEEERTMRVAGTRKGRVPFGLVHGAAEAVVVSVVDDVGVLGGGGAARSALGLGEDGCG